MPYKQEKMTNMNTIVSERNPNLALVAMHALPEATGLALLESARRERIDGWDVEVVDYEAVEAGVRYVRRNMATGFGKADLNSDVYDLRRPAEVLASAKGRRRVLDIHDRPGSTGEYVAIGRSGDMRLLEAATLLGIGAVIMQTHEGTIVHNDPNVLTVELCRADGEGSEYRIKENVERLRRCMRYLATGATVDVDPQAFNYYQYEGEISSPEAYALGLQDRGSIQPFEPIPPDIIETLGLPQGPYVAEYWNGINSSNGEYFGGILREVSVPAWR
jgi:hypothetical protein